MEPVNGLLSNLLKVFMMLSVWDGGTVVGAVGSCQLSHPGPSLAAGLKRGGEGCVRKGHQA